MFYFSILLFLVFFYFTFGYGKWDKTVEEASATDQSIDCSANPTITQGIDFAVDDDVTLTTGGTCTLAGTSQMNSLTINSGVTLQLADDITLTVVVSTSVAGTLSFGSGNSFEGAGNVTVASGGLITHSIYTTTVSFVPKVIFNISGDFTIDSGGTVSTTGIGYLGGYQGTNVSMYGCTENNVCDSSAGSYYGSGGSHGGRGGLNSTNQIAESYDSISNPTLPGGGGGSTGSVLNAGGNGGGVVRIVAINIVVNGNIEADGEVPVTNIDYGGGAGGTIYLNASGVISGSGDITADGGITLTAVVGGGGGRIALLYGSYTHSGSLTAYGGNGNGVNEDGSAGTIFKKATGDASGYLFVDNGGLSSAYLFSNISSVNDMTFDGVTTTNYGNLWIKPDATSFTALNVQVDINSIFENSLDSTYIDISSDSLNLNGGTAQFDGTLSLTNFDTSSSGSTGTLITQGITSISSGAFVVGTNFTWKLTSSTNSTIRKSAGVNLDSFTVVGTLQLNHNTLSVDGNAIINSGGVISHDGYTAVAGYTPGVFLSLTGNLTIDSGGAVSSTGKGYLGGRQIADSYYWRGLLNTGDFNNTNYGCTENNVCSSGTSSEYGSGGSHGGRGGLNTTYTIAQSYDSISNPTLPGGGGGGNTTLNLGGNGGGIIRVTATNIAVNGSIEADGQVNIINVDYGGGAGGTIYLNASGIISGNGAITADGGITNTTKVGGGGGRIALLYDSYTHSGSLTAYGGNSDGSNEDGAAGTIFLKGTGDSNGFLRINNGGNTQAYHFTNIRSTNDMTFDGVSTTNYGNLWIEPDATSFSATIIQADEDSVIESGPNMTYTDIGPDNLFLNGGTMQFDGTLSLTNFDTTGVTATGTLITHDLTTISSGALVLGERLTWKLTSSTNSEIKKDAITNMDSLTVSGTLQLNHNTLTVAGNVDVKNGGVITHELYTTNASYTPAVLLSLTGNLAIDSGGAVSSTGKGYLGGRQIADSYYWRGLLNTGDFNNTNYGCTENNVCSSGTSSEYGSGGSHGGRGGLNTTYTIAQSYDSISNPTLPGGGGGGNTTLNLGGNGGGIIRVTATNIAVNGSIEADGQVNITNVDYGGGAGGTIYLNASGIISGNGAITADGGITNTVPVGGGGGRVALLYGSYTYLGALTAYGGDGNSTNRDAAAGTVHKKPTGQTYGDLIISNGSAASPYYNTTVSSTVPASDQVVAYNNGYVFNSVTVSSYGILNIPVGLDAVGDGTSDPNRKIRCITCTTDDDDATNGEIVYDTELFSGGFASDYTCVLTNNLPTLASLTLTPVKDATGYVSVSTIIDDGDDEDTQLRVEYRSGDCSAYSGYSSSTLHSTITATYGQENITLNNSDSVGRQLKVITTASGANTLSFTWLSQTDVPTADGQYCLFLTPYDGNDNGDVTSSTLTLDNVVPATPGSLTLDSATTASLTLDFGVVSSDTNFREYKIFYKAGASGASTSDTAHTSSTDGNLGADDYNSALTTAISGLSVNTQYVFNIWAYDEYNNISSPAGVELAKYTSANAPGAPTVTAASASTLGFTINTNSNPAATTYAIYDSDTGYYVAADNGLDSATAIWQTSAVWSNPTITGLSPNTQHTFEIIARNGDNTETATTTASAIYTLVNSAGTPTIGTPTVSVLPITIDDNSNPAATTYAIYNATDGNYIAADGSTTAVGVYQASSTWGADFNVTGLSANTAYQFQVISRNGDNVNSATSTASTAKYTSANAPSALAGTAASATSINLTWSGDADEYYVENTTASTNSGWISTASYSATGLTCATSYTFKVKGRNGDDEETGYSSTVSVTTNECTVTVSAGGGFAPAPPPIFPLYFDESLERIEKDGYGVFIGSGNGKIGENIIDLSFNGGPDAVEMAVSNLYNFFGISKESYETFKKDWDICYGLPQPCPSDGKKYGIYVKFYTEFGIPSQILSSEVVYEEPREEIVVEPVEVESADKGTLIPILSRYEIGTSYRDEIPTEVGEPTVAEEIAELGQVLVDQIEPTIDRVIDTVVSPGASVVLNAFNVAGVMIDNLTLKRATEFAQQAINFFSEVGEKTFEQIKNIKDDVVKTAVMIKEILMTQEWKKSAKKW